MASLFHNIKANLSENKEDWYNICQEAESALFRVKNACGDELAIKTLERMILELNNIRMERYEALTEYALVEESFGGNFEGKKITTNLHNDKTNPIWIIGDISIDSTNYRVNAKVFQEPSEFGIDKGPVSKLYIAREDKYGESTAIINYDRGWDIKPTEETKEIYNIALGAVCSYRNSHPYEADPEEEPINESVDEDDYIDPNYKVDIRNLNLTNGGYHNNSNAIYGRIKLSPKGDLEPGVYDIIFLPEGEYLYVFKPGTDVRSAVDYLYMNDGMHDDEWVKWNGRRVQIKDFNTILEEDTNRIEPPIDQFNSIVGAIEEAYFNDNPIPLNRVNYQ